MCCGPVHAEEECDGDVVVGGADLAADLGLGAPEDVSGALDLLLEGLELLAERADGGGAAGVADEPLARAGDNEVAADGEAVPGHHIARGVDHVDLDLLRRRDAEDLAGLVLAAVGDGEGRGLGLEEEADLVGDHPGHVALDERNEADALAAKEVLEAGDVAGDELVLALDLGVADPL